MARSPLTLAASASAALPDAEITKATLLSAGGAGRNEAALAWLADGTQVVIRRPNDQESDAELATEALALNALSAGVRALVDFAVPSFLGASTLDGARVFITTFVPGYLVDAAYLPAGRGASTSVGRALGAIHALPPSVVRSAGLPERSAGEVREDARRVMEDSAATGRVPVRLMHRWREAIEDDALWRFESTVTLGGIGADAFAFEDVDGAPRVSGVLTWHGLQVGDPAVDLQFLEQAPEAAETILATYAASLLRATDEHVITRARLHSELDVARWLLHGRDRRDEAILEDASAMLDQLAEGVRDTELHVPTPGADLDDAIAALESVPAPKPVTIDTSMHTDTYDPDELDLQEKSEGEPQAAAAETEVDLEEEVSAVAEVIEVTEGSVRPLDFDTEAFDDLPRDSFADSGPIALDEEDDPRQSDAAAAEAQRAAKAAILRWSQAGDDLPPAAAARS